MAKECMERNTHIPNAGQRKQKDEEKKRKEKKKGKRTKRIHKKE